MDRLNKWVNGLSKVQYGCLLIAATIFAIGLDWLVTR